MMLQTDLLPGQPTGGLSQKQRTKSKTFKALGNSEFSGPGRDRQELK